VILIFPQASGGRGGRCRVVHSSSSKRREHSYIVNSNDTTIPRGNNRSILVDSGMLKSVTIAKGCPAGETKARLLRFFPILR